MINTTDKKFLGLSMGQAVILITQIVTVVWFAGNLKSDVRDNTTRIVEHDREISDLKHDRSEVHESLSDLKKDIGILLERTKPK